MGLQKSNVEAKFLLESRGQARIPDEATGLHTCAQAGHAQPEYLDWSIVNLLL